MKKKRIFIVLIVIAVFLVFGAWLKEPLEIDSCLDNGGRWNYEEKNCEFERTD
jgi:hypothetical protein